MLPADSPDVLERYQSALDLVDMIAGQILRALRGLVNRDDLLGPAREGLLAAARRFDPARGVPFRAYASLRIRGAILDDVRRLTLPRRAFEQVVAMRASTLMSQGEAEVAFAQSGDPGGAEEALGVFAASTATSIALALQTATPPDQSAPCQNAEEAIASAELSALVKAAMAELRPDESEIIRRYYLESESMTKIARDLNISKSWISRTHTRAIGRLRKRLGNLD